MRHKRRVSAGRAVGCSLARLAPERGRIGIFNRSYYEEVLVVRVHPEVLGKQNLPKPLVTKHIWEERFNDISGFERYATRNGIVIRKFMDLAFPGVDRRKRQELALAREMLDGRYGIISTMVTTMDAAGRLVIPREI